MASNCIYSYNGDRSECNR